MFNLLHLKIQNISGRKLYSNNYKTGTEVTKIFLPKSLSHAA